MTAQFAEWKQYTNPKSKKSGWISAGGQVRYDDPRKADDEKKKARATAHEAFNATRGNGNKIGEEHVDAIRAHLNTLTRDQKRELAKSISAHVGGTKANLVDRLLAYAKGEEQPAYPKKPPSQTLVAVVQRYGGIDPNSHDFKTNYGNMKEAIQDGIDLGVFRKKGTGLDALAEEMHNDGYINVPSGEHPGTHLLEQLKAGVHSKHADTVKEYDAALEEYYKAEQAAQAWAEGKEGKDQKKKIEKAKKKLTQPLPKKEPEEELFPFGANASAEPKEPAHVGKPVYAKDVKLNANGEPEHAAGSNPAAVAWLANRTETDPGLQAVKSYTANDYAEVNEGLRVGGLDGKFQRIHEDMQKVFADAPDFPEPIQVTRGLRLKGDKLQAFLQQIRGAQTSGQPLVHSGYASTTTVPDSLVKIGPNVLLSIKAKRGIDIQPVSHYPDENEILLNHGTKLKVIGVTSQGGNYRVQMEQVE